MWVRLPSRLPNSIKINQNNRNKIQCNQISLKKTYLSLFKTNTGKLKFSFCTILNLRLSSSFAFLVPFSQRRSLNQNRMGKRPSWGTCKQLKNDLQGILRRITSRGDEFGKLKPRHAMGFSFALHGVGGALGAWQAVHLPV